jgi:hypothetical protein
MPRRISWKKGMRLTDEVLTASDECAFESIDEVTSLVSCGRIGLIPDVENPFELQLSITKGFVEVEALTCKGVTRGGMLIDADFDTKYTNTLDGRMQIPHGSEEREYVITINVDPDEWKEDGEGYLEPNYTFALVTPKSGISPYALPIGRIIYEDGWREDNVNFVPPCLTIGAHNKFMQLFQQFVQMMQAIDETAHKQMNTAAHTAMSIFWPVVREQLINAVTLQDTMSPQQLQGCVQKVVSAFVIACDLDELLNLEDAELFRSYSVAGYSYRMAYTRIKQGLGMCYAISQKVEKFGLLVKEEPKPTPPPAPEPPKPEPPKPNPKRFWEGKQI